MKNNVIFNSYNVKDSTTYSDMTFVRVNIMSKNKFHLFDNYT